LKIAIIINSSKENALSIAKESIDILLASGAEILITEEFKNIFKNVNVLKNEQLYELADIIVVIGGDGTIIHSAKKAAEFSKPVLGINAGRVGYLAGLEGNELGKLKNLLSGDYSIKSRMLLSVQIGEKEYLSLNDAVISKGPVSRMIDITVKLHGECISYRADGLIAATPVGSTAYSLSAGGPIVDPSVENMTVTPICSHSLTARPMLFRDNAVLEVKNVCQREKMLYLTVDGRINFELYRGDLVRITRSPMKTRLVRLHERGFYATLQEKMKSYT